MSRNANRRKTFVLSYLEGAFYAMMVGTAETYALVYAVKRGITDSEFGILSTLPILFGALSSWVGPSYTRTNQIKRGILLAVLLQLLGLSAFIISTRLPTESLFPVLLLGLTLYWIGGMASGPLWLDWMSGWLPGSKLRPFLSRRNSFVATVTVLTYIAASHLLIREDRPRLFIFVFGFALIMRIGSFICLYFQKTPSRTIPLQEITSIFPRNLNKYPWVIFLLLITVLFKFSAGMASPYFTPYLLKELDLPLRDFVWITSIPFVARAVSLAQWGSAGGFFQPLAGLKISCFGLAGVAWLWSHYSSTSVLILIEVLSGVFWAAFDLSIVLILQSYFRQNTRQIIGLNVALMSSAALLASYLGGKILESGTSFQDLFRNSAYLRAAVALMLIGAGARFSELRSTRKNYQEFLTSTLSLRPSLVNIGRLIPTRYRTQSKEER